MAGQIFRTQGSSTKWSTALLVGLASFALIWIVHRAIVQAITLDEANTYLFWVGTASPSHWTGHSNNHVLNSALMRLAVWLFGVSELSLRLPALLGGAIYIASMCVLVCRLSGELVLRLALFTCFVFNPFVMDYLVAARGYGLAIGFLGFGISLLAHLLANASFRPERRLVKVAALLSASSALSFCANFSWVYANGALLLAALAWMIFKCGQWRRIAAAGVLPGALIVLVFAGSALIDYPREHLIWGTNSMGEMWKDIRWASFPKLNAYLVNPLLGSILKLVEKYFVWAGLVLLVLFLAGARNQWKKSEDFRLPLVGTLTAVTLATVLAHWLQFQLLKIPLPFERTSLFLVPLITAIVGMAVALQSGSRLQRIVHLAGTFLLCLIGVYFVGTLRDGYFREWSICADLKTVFAVVEKECKRTGTREVISDLDSTPSLNFYRLMSKTDSLDELANFPVIPAGKEIYVLPAGRFADFVQRENLKAVYRGSESDITVFIRR